MVNMVDLYAVDGVRCWRSSSVLGISSCYIHPKYCTAIGGFPHSVIRDLQLFGPMAPSI